MLDAFGGSAAVAYAFKCDGKSVTYNDRGKYDKAREVYSQTLSRTYREPSNLDPFAKGKIANMHAEISQAYQDVGMILEALEELEKAVRLRPAFADLRTRLGTLYRDNGQTARAREEFEVAKQANPKYLQARLALGVLLLSAGDRNEATAEFHAVLEQDPENKSAQMYLRIAAAQATASIPPPAPGGSSKES